MKCSGGVVDVCLQETIPLEIINQDQKQSTKESENLSLSVGAT